MFTINGTDGAARRGSFITPHGVIETPVFMNVATQAAIKGGVSALDLLDIHCQTALCNTYHLHLRPGEDVVAELGGLHGFMRYPGPILTDSGGFQVFSLSGLRKISEEGVLFASHLDGRRILMTPESSMMIQGKLGSDIAMAFDECFENPATHDYAAASIERTTRWLTRCRDAWLLGRDGSTNPGQVLFGINQGGVYNDLRARHMTAIAALDLPGYAIGGLAVGESAQQREDVLRHLLPLMPIDKPRYLMGVGKPGDILLAIALGVDFFDCVLPARNARHGHVYTRQGCLNLKNEKHKQSELPIDTECHCPTCTHFSRAYLRHLLAAGEVLALRLCVLHNLYFYNTMMEQVRQAIEEKRLMTYFWENAERFDRRI